MVVPVYQNMIDSCLRRPSAVGSGYCYVYWPFFQLHGLLYAWPLHHPLTLREMHWHGVGKADLTGEGLSYNHFRWCLQVNDVINVTALSSNRSVFLSANEPVLFPEVPWIEVWGIHYCFLEVLYICVLWDFHIGGLAKSPTCFLQEKEKRTQKMFIMPENGSEVELAHNHSQWLACLVNWLLWTLNVIMKCLEYAPP